MKCRSFIQKIHYRSHTAEFTIELITRLIKLIPKESAACLAVKWAKAKQGRIPVLFLLRWKKRFLIKYFFTLVQTYIHSYTLLRLKALFPQKAIKSDRLLLQGGKKKIFPIEFSKEIMQYEKLILKRQNLMKEGKILSE